MLRRQYLERLFVLCSIGFYLVRPFDFVDVHEVRQLANKSTCPLLGFFGAGR